MRRDSALAEAMRLRERRRRIGGLSGRHSRVLREAIAALWARPRPHSSARRLRRTPQSAGAQPDSAGRRGDFHHPQLSGVTIGPRPTAPSMWLRPRPTSPPTSMRSSTRHAAHQARVARQPEQPTELCAVDEIKRLAPDCRHMCCWCSTPPIGLMCRARYEWIELVATTENTG